MEPNENEKCMKYHKNEYVSQIEDFLFEINISYSNLWNIDIYTNLAVCYSYNILCFGLNKN